MGSLRNPIGPLPSSIYWRRRVVLLSVMALLALVVTWFVTSDDGGGSHDAKGSGGKNPASSITPGPSGSGPAISQAPGGRDESSGGATEGSDPGSGSGSDTGSGGGGSGAGGSGAGGSGSDGSGTGGGGTDDGANGGGSSATLPAGTTLPNCTASVVRLTLRSVRNSYSPDETPTFQLVAKNSSASDCKVDLGPKTAVLTITKAGSEDDYWSSADCPKAPGSLLYRVPAGGDFTYTLKWDRKPSAAECATPPAGVAGAGTYLVEAKAPGFATAQTSFVLAAD
ncbi:hypothetical protein [Streptomyces sp. DSM 15324]|uniref:hypothetical protein n=1 Tax=Streptomyces sp. DSM 15324 TaxID=1739111 RepID=UPI0008311E43|nr:hypothetical protein [Streptomyces sp. DSM 15324]